jgi:hypothetical protein
MASVLFNPDAACPPDVCDRPSTKRCNSRWRFQRTAATDIQSLSNACSSRFNTLRASLCQDPEVKAVTDGVQTVRVLYTIHVYDNMGNERDVETVGEGLCP